MKADCRHRLKKTQFRNFFKGKEKKSLSISTVL
ncbi:hypothetical protein CCA_00081 [Chlamydia caviae GPIC]|uniref:Uncharacterized protein n=1 Tax=Chlamydia caviae (strain ATCC VR-813 / DSM 19441 / 03DC25 / GPIC) TaxID=227941 RepID=Q824R1_CHLCV|nr:hypothetical protein CCA_00081 [Chlamydia caviae GPIC]